jgi:pimeloyl-ACP methyl ester carboxylesterase
MELNHFRAGTGAPLVLIHGIGSRWELWNPVLAALEAERDVIALDLPGFGQSPMPPPGTPPGVPTLTTLVSEFLDSLGLEKPHVAGNSLGGWISLELAKRGRVASATALSPGGFYNDRESAYARGFLKMMRRTARLLAPRAEQVTKSAFGRTVAFSAVTARPARIPPADAALHLRGLAEAPWFEATLEPAVDDRFSGGEQITVPTTVAWGARDRLLLPRQARRAQRLIPSARVFMLEGCGHVPTYDDPERVAAVLLEGSADGQATSAAGGRGGAVPLA